MKYIQISFFTAVQHMQKSVLANLTKRLFLPFMITEKHTTLWIPKVLILLLMLRTDALAVWEFILSKRLQAELTIQTKTDLIFLQFF